VALGARDGQLLSGRAIDDDDPLSRRDQGLEFLDVTRQIRIDHAGIARPGQAVEEVVTFTNSSDTVVDTHLLIVVQGLPRGVRLRKASGTTRSGEPYVRVFLPGGVLNPGQHISQAFTFDGLARRQQPTYRFKLLSGQGAP